MISEQKKLVILIPAFNEEKTISTVIQGLPKKLPGIDTIQCIVVDDGSTDQTRKLALATGARVVSHSVQKGVGAALQTGIDQALSIHADYAVNIDADGQFDAADISKLLTPVENGEADVVVGDRFASDLRPDNMPALKYFGNKAMSFLVSLLIGKKFRDVSCGFRAYSAEALLNLNLFGDFTYTQETFLDLVLRGFVIKQVPVSVKYFSDRKSRVAGSLTRFAYHTSKIIIRTITFHRPFRFLGYPGLALLTVGVIFLVFLVGHWFLFGSFSPYKAYGFIGGGLMLFGFLMLVLALLADTIDRLRKIQERVLYYEKKKFYNFL